MCKLNITAGVLDRLGFSKYQEENPFIGGRTLTFKDGTEFSIIEQLEMEDGTQGTIPNGHYVSNHFYWNYFYAGYKDRVSNHELFFLSEMNECLNLYYSDYVEEFVQLCKEAKMLKYLPFYYHVS